MAAAATPTGYAGARYESGNRRDPFLNPLLTRKDQNADEEAPKGTPPPGIAGMYIKDVELLGMAVNSEGQTAAFKGTDKRVYFLHVGDRLFDGYIKSITLDSVQLIHETTLRSGKVLTQEITKRLRTL
jgi:Tfp pilus assembly protein PilP